MNQISPPTLLLSRPGWDLTAKPQYKVVIAALGCELQAPHLPAALAFLLPKKKGDTQFKKWHVSLAVEIAAAKTAHNAPAALTLLSMCAYQAFESLPSVSLASLQTFKNSFVIQKRESFLIGARSPTAAKTQFYYSIV